MQMFMKGLLELYVLSKARRGPVSGKEIIRSVSKATKGRWKPSPGSIYPILASAEKQGLLRQKPRKKGSGRKVEYALTAKGKLQLKGKRKKYLTESSKELLQLFPLLYEIAGITVDEKMIGLVTEVDEMLSVYRRNLILLYLQKRVEERKVAITGTVEAMLKHLQEFEGKRASSGGVMR